MIKENERFGNLTTVKIVGKAKGRQNIWECKCDCGNTIRVISTSLTSQNTRSCGCLRKNVLRKKGLKNRKTNEYDLSGEFGIGYTSKGEPFFFDLEDYDLIKDYNWRYNADKYVVSYPYSKLIRMHILIMKPEKGKDVDHKNHITYDNRKTNLRVCEHYENIISSKTYSNNTSGRKGVSYDKNRKKWMASITVNKKTIFLGRYDKFEDALAEREKAEQQYHKEFSYK